MNTSNDSDEKRIASIFPKSLLYRIFDCPVIDLTLENELFKILADQGFAPKLIYQCEKYRIEEYFESRSLTIWEMSNDWLMTTIARMICDFHYCSKGRECTRKFSKDKVTQIETCIKEWHPKVAQRVDKIRERKNWHPG